MRPSSLRVLSHLRSLQRCQLYFSRPAYIVLLPEIPSDTPASNPLLRCDINPPFSRISAENCVNAIGKLVIDYECELARLSDSMRVADANIQPVRKSFSNVFDPLAKLAAPLDRAWSVVKLLYLVQYSQSMAKAYKMLHTRVQKARVQRFLSLPIYHNVRELDADKKQLDESQRRVVNKYLLESRLKGIDLSTSQREHMSNIVGKLASEKELMRRKLDEATNRFFHLINDKNVVKEFPVSLLQRMAVDRNPSRGPWRVSLRPEVYDEFMKHCPDRMLRWNTWFANVTKASSHSDAALNTSVHIEEIRYQRRDEAKLLGFESFADMSMETKMAGSVNNVRTMIATLYKWSKRALQQQLTQLQEFAAANGFPSTLELWDVPYWRNKQKQEILGMEENDLRFYFPLEKVLEGLFQLCNNLFGIYIEAAPIDNELWDDAVTSYNVFDADGKTHLGTFYLDLFLRPNTKLSAKSWIECSRDAKSRPVCYIVLNTYPPLTKRPALLTIDEVTRLFQKFGHCLQHILCTVPYEEVSGLTNVEWDAVDVCPHVMANLLFQPDTLRLVSNHYETKQPLSDELIQKIRQARFHMWALDLTHNLYLSSLDLSLYSNQDFWIDVMRRLWTDFLPFPLDKRDSHPCSFSTIFCDELPAAFYSSTWAEMIAADIFVAFEEAQSTSSKTSVKQVGSRFRDTFLSLGGGCHPSEIFRRFRGRDPSPEALLTIRQLKN